MVETLKFSQIGLEDLNIGTGTFEVDTADGRRITLTQINLASFIPSDILNDQSVLYTDGTDIGQDTNFLFDKDNNQLTLGANHSIMIGSTDSASRALEIKADGQTGIRINNSGVTTNDVLIEFSMHDVVDWNMRVDDSDSDNFVISAGTTVSATPHIALLRDKNSVQIGTTTENTLNDGGLTIHNGSRDDEALSLQNSDVAHGITTLANTSTYMFLGKANTTAGGGRVRGFSETVVGLSLDGFVTTEDTTDTSGSEAAIFVDAQLKSGTSTTDMGTTANIFGVANNGTTRMVVKGDGDVHVTNTTLVALDEHNDIELLEALRTTNWPGYKQQLGDWVDENLDVLEEAGVTYGSGRYISHQGLSGLIIDALRQVGRRLDALERGGVAPIRRSRIGEGSTTLGQG